MTHQWTESNDCGLELPLGQKVIPTNNLKLAYTLLDMTMLTKEQNPIISAIVGRGGTGKTVAVDSYIQQQKPLPGTGMPAVIKVEVKPQPIPKGLATDIALELEDEVNGSTVYKIADDITETIKNNYLKMIIIDEADRLSDDSLELLQYIFDNAKCPIVLVGIPSIWRLIKRDEKIKSRVGLKLNFRPIEEEELLENILPKMTFENWHFDPKSELDLKMGKYILKDVGSSLRRLRDLLQNANNITPHMSGCEHITLEVIQAVLALMPENDERKKVFHDDFEDETGEYERESEKRNKAKKRRK